MRPRPMAGRALVLRIEPLAGVRPIRASITDAYGPAPRFGPARFACVRSPHGDGRLPIDNNWIENQIRPVALGRKNWLFAGSQRAGRRAAAVMSLIQSAKMNGHDPYAYLTDVLMRLPTHPASRIDELLPQNWRPQAR